MKKQFSLILLSLTLFNINALPAQAATEEAREKAPNSSQMCIEFPGFKSFICI